MLCRTRAEDGGLGCLSEALNDHTLGGDGFAVWAPSVVSIFYGCEQVGCFCCSESQVLHPSYDPCVFALFMSSLYIHISKSVTFWASVLVVFYCFFF